MNLDNADIDVLLQREGGKILFDSPQGVIARANGDSTVMSNILSPDEFFRGLKEASLEDADLFCVKSEAVAETICRKLGPCRVTKCAQWVFNGDHPFEGDYSDIRQLDGRYSSIVAENYSMADHEEYIVSRINDGKMWGIFEGDTLAGFIGIHDEGSVGMLEVLPQYRRKGYGYLLESYVLNMHIKNGWVAYSHVIDGNDVSTALQKKLGFKKSELPSIWVSRRRGEN